LYREGIFLDFFSHQNESIEFSFWVKRKAKIQIPKTLIWVENWMTKKNTFAGAGLSSSAAIVCSSAIAILAALNITSSKVVFLGSSSRVLLHTY
jgi:galactokinase